MKLLLSVAAVALVACAFFDTVSSSCVCSQWTCTTNVCETDIPGCKKPRPFVSGQGFIEDSADGVTYSMQVGTKLNWVDSVKKCQEQGFTHLATVTTEAQFKLIHTMRDTAYKSDGSYSNQFWVSFNKIGKPAWSWSPNNETTFPSHWWGQGEPNNETCLPTTCLADVACACLRSDAGFNDAQCTPNLLYRICQAPACRN